MRIIRRRRGGGDGGRGEEEEEKKKRRKMRRKALTSKNFTVLIINNPKYSIAVQLGAVHTHIMMFLCYDIEETGEIWPAEVSYRSQASEQTPPRDFLEVPLTDILKNKDITINEKHKLLSYYVHHDSFLLFPFRHYSLTLF